MWQIFFGNSSQTLAFVIGKDLQARESSPSRLMENFAHGSSLRRLALLDVRASDTKLHALHELPGYWVMNSVVLVREWPKLTDLLSGRQSEQLLDGGSLRGHVCNTLVTFNFSHFLGTCE